EGVDGLTMALTSAGIVINKKAIDNTVVDYVLGDGETNATELVVAVGPADTVTFAMNDTYGDYAQVTGSATINLFDLVSVTGSFGVEKRTNQDLYISGSTTANTLVHANLLSIGLSNVSAFVGFNGIGLQLTDVDLAIALWSEIVTTGTARKWTSVMASVGSASFEGVEGLTMALTSAGIVINKKAADNTVVDYVKGAGETAATELTVTVGPTDTVTFAIDDINGDYAQVTGSATIDLFGFVSITGSFGVEKKTNQTVTLSTGVSATVNVLTIGLTNVSAFLGFGEGTDEAMGFQLTDVDFALALFSETAGAMRKWTSVKGSVGSASFVGLTGLGLIVSTLGIEINKKAADGSLIDYADNPLSVVVGPEDTVILDMDGSEGELLRAFGSVTLEIADFVTISGSFGFEKRTTGTTSTLLIGAAGITTFLGTVDGTMGVRIKDAGFGMVLYQQAGGNKYALTATGAAELVGFEDI
ncbi:MAG: hypothetical protein AAGU05_11090, partial [Anaerolineaceae bacterium]